MPNHSQREGFDWIRIGLGLPGGSDNKASVCIVGDPGLIPVSGISSGEGNDNPLQYPCLENPMDRGSLYATVHGVAKSRTRLSDFTHSGFKNYGFPLKQDLMKSRASLVAQRLKRLPAMQETWVQSLGWADSLEKEMATHFTIAWRIPWTEEPGGLYSPWVHKEWDRTERLDFTFTRQL